MTQDGEPQIEKKQGVFCRQTGGFIHGRSSGPFYPYINFYVAWGIRTVFVCLLQDNTDMTGFLTSLQSLDKCRMWATGWRGYKSLPVRETRGQVKPSSRGTAYGTLYGTRLPRTLGGKTSSRKGSCLHAGCNILQRVRTTTYGKVDKKWRRVRGSTGGVHGCIWATYGMGRICQKGDGWEDSLQREQRVQRHITGKKRDVQA